MEFSRGERNFCGRRCGQTGSGAVSTAVALAVAGEIWISDSEANSEVADEAEYDDGAVERRSARCRRAQAQKTLRRRTGASTDGFDVFGADVSEGKFEIWLGRRVSRSGKSFAFGFFPGGGCAALLAIAQDVSVDGVDVLFDVALFNVLRALGTCCIRGQFAGWLVRTDRDGGNSIGQKSGSGSTKVTP